MIGERTHSRKLLIGASATTYLALAVWLGPHAAFYLILAAAWIVFWLWLCGRFPAVGMFTSAFLVGLVQGLVGGRSGYYRRRRW